MTEIVVICPVLGRPQNAQPFVDSLCESGSDTGLVFVCSPGDEDQIAACQETGMDMEIAPWMPEHGDFAKKINYATFELTTNRFIFQGADDIEFTPGWDTAALETIESGEFGVCGTNDTANPMVRAGYHSTHSLIRRSYAEQCGASWDGPRTVFSEAYSHNWCDNELVELAKFRGCWSFAFGSIVRHRHPIWGTAEWDETYEKGAADERTDRDRFLARQKLWLSEAA